MLLSRIEPLLPSIRSLALVSIGIAIGLRHAHSVDHRGSDPIPGASKPDVGTQHREDIKAAIRKRYGSTAAFEAARGLPSRSVTDVLRGKPSERTTIAIAEELGMPVADVLRVTRPEVDRWISGGAGKKFRFRKARTERGS